MKFKNFLNEGRSEYIKEEDAKELLLTKCSQALEQYKKGHIIWRKVAKFQDRFGIVDPSKHRERYSANTYNYYTLIMNNHPMWKDYPKREIICSGGNGDRAKGQSPSSWSYLFFVFPFNGAKVGICPKDDVWDSFEKVRELGFVDMDDFNSILMNRDFTHDDWERFEKELKQTIYSDKYGGVESDDITWYDKITDVLDPENNDFKVVNISNYNLTKSDDVEVWLDSKCVLVNYYESDFLRTLK